MKLTFDLKRFLKLSAFILALVPVAIVVITVGLARAYTKALLYAGCQGDFASLASYGFPAEEIEFSSSDDLPLRGWLTVGSSYPDTAIIVSPGHLGNSAIALEDAKRFANAGFTTLVYEPRFCAHPELPASTGLFEAHDVAGAADYLALRPDINAVGAFGFSTGGTASILASAETTSIDAVIAMGGYDSLRNDVLEGIDSASYYEKVTKQLILWFFEREGLPVDHSNPIHVIESISPRPIFLIYGEHEQDSGYALYNAANQPKTLWIVPDAGHGEYALRAPEEYPDRITEFFTTTLTTTSE